MKKQRVNTNRITIIETIYTAKMPRISKSLRCARWMVISKLKHGGWNQVSIHDGPNAVLTYVKQLLGMSLRHEHIRLVMPGGHVVAEARTRQSR